MNKLENDIKKILLVFIFGWIMSVFISIFILDVYWFGIGGGWNIELTLLICWNLGIIGILIIITLISVFLRRFKIVRKD